MASTRSPDGRALLISMWTSAAFAVVALVWGLATGSQLIVFDGLGSHFALPARAPTSGIRGGGRPGSR